MKAKGKLTKFIILNDKLRILKMGTEEPQEA